ncbi:MAG: twin-arginine translocation signal domain-containing protein, partial [Ginsengibacter sp.]
MKNILQQIAEKNKEQERIEANDIQKEINDPSTGDSRRSFLKNTALGGIALTGLMSLSFEDTIAETTSKVRRSSSPSDLKITDLRYTTISNG